MRVKWDNLLCSLTHWLLGDLKTNHRKIIFQLILASDGCDISSEFALRWASLDLSDDKSTLAQVMAWCRHATSPHPNQCWPRSLPPYGVIRPQCVNVYVFFISHYVVTNKDEPHDALFHTVEQCKLIKSRRIRRSMILVYLAVLLETLDLINHTV